jgi:hypothetical protein
MTGWMLKGDQKARNEDVTSRAQPEIQAHSPIPAVRLNLSRAKLRNNYFVTFTDAEPESGVPSLSVAVTVIV